jgi:hypothetical protein
MLAFPFSPFCLLGCLVGCATGCAGLHVRDHSPRGVVCQDQRGLQRQRSILPGDRPVPPSHPWMVVLMRAARGNQTTAVVSRDSKFGATLVINTSKFSGWVLSKMPSIHFLSLCASPPPLLFFYFVFVGADGNRLFPSSPRSDP